VRIVHIITRLILGGAQENTVLTCKMLAKRGHEVALITGPALGPEGDLYEQANGQDFDFIILDDLRRQINPHYDVPAYYSIKKILREYKPDIVHTHSAKAGILGRYAAYSLKRHCEPAEGGRGNLRPQIVHTLHGLAFHPYQNNLLNKFYIAAEKAAAKRTDFFISVADAMTNQALAAGIGSPDKFVTAYSAIEEDNFLKTIPAEKLNEFRYKYAIMPDDIVLVTIARLFHLKGHEFIIESAKRLAERFPKAIWLFVGDGILADQYKKWIHDLGLGHRFRFTGLLSPDKIPLAIQSSDVLVHCSLREGLARTLPQAMLCGKPVVSFDVDGAREVVNENTGRLIEPKNIEQLTDACAELLGDKALREKLGGQGRESVKTRFAPDTMVDTIEAVYRRLLS
jgi:glycosyltransferase involved in cell wall biosynthesis